MKWVKKIAFVIACISVIELIVIQPIIAPFFGMNFIWQIIYCLVIFGFPVLIIIPIGILMMPISYLLRAGRNFKSVWINFTLTTFLILGSFILVFNSIILISKYSIGKDPFALTKYSEIVPYQGEVEDLKTGEFESSQGSFTRYENKKIERYENGDSSIFSVEWLSTYEYRLINQGENHGMNDTLDVKITNNTPEYYECYLRFGKYAQLETILKK